MWQGFINLIADALVFLNSFLAGFGLPYSFGFAIILFTVLIKLLTFPLNQTQLRSSRAMQDLQPKLKAIQKKYANDKEKLAQAQMDLYKEAGVNPLGGCLPMLVQMPVWFALYRALYQLAGPDVGVLGEGFFWIPSLAGPVSDFGQGLSWLNPSAEAFLGWGHVSGYLVLPVLLVVSQLYMQRSMTPQSDDPQQQAMSKAMMFMPLMFGYFSLIVPSGLTLYWFTNNILTVGQQRYLYWRLDQEKEAKEQQSTTSPEDYESIEDFNDSLTPSFEGAKNGTGIQKREKSNDRHKSKSKRKRKKQR